MTTTMNEVDVIEGVKPQKDYLLLSLFSVLFCPLLGILALWKSGKTRRKSRQGDTWHAELAALDALKWSMAAIVIGGALYFIALLVGIYYLVVFHYGGAESPFIDLSLAPAPDS